MKILNLYIAKKLAFTIAGAVFIMTFVMVSGSLIKMIDLIEKGMPIKSFITIIFLILPDSLTFSIPLGVLIATILVFGKLSGENEINAMRSSGIGLWQIISPGIILSLLLCAFCFYVHFYLGPVNNQKLRVLTKELAYQNPTLFLQAGEYLKLGESGNTIFIKKRKGQKLFGVRLLIYDNANQLKNVVYSLSGKLIMHPKKKKFEMRLFNVHFNSITYKDGIPKNHYGKAGESQYFFDFNQKKKKASSVRKVSSLTLPALLVRLKILQEEGRKRYFSKILFYLNKRIVFSLSPIVFYLIGMPLAIKTNRSETSYNIVISLGLVMFFYFFILLADAFRKKTGLHPEFIVWIPGIVYQIVGLVMLKKITAT